jgi:hypothetical protein
MLLTLRKVVGTFLRTDAEPQVRCSLQRKQSLVQGTAFKRAALIGLPHSTHTP